MSDPFSHLTKGFDSPGDTHYPITPHDDNELDKVPRAIWVNTDGDIAMVDGGGQEITYTVKGGCWIPFRAVKIKATGTTATGIVGWY